MRLAFLMLMVVLAAAPALNAADDYKPCAEATPRDGVPKGKVEKRTFKSKVFENTMRDYYIYVPAQYDGKTPACVMVFQDGHAYINEKGDVRAGIVFDNLIAAKEMPVTIGIFINPGAHPDKQAADAKPDAWKADNRSFEYDTLSDQYSKFLLEEILPEVAKQYKLTDDPEGRAICGMSSGGICAFTVAWERPDAFRKVLSHIGSFTSIAYRPATADRPARPGGEVYPTLIRRTKGKPKPIRVFLEDGSHDLDNQFGSWFLANQQMAAALKFAGYEVETNWGENAHSGKHGGSIFADSLRWLWKGYQAKG